jgi:hypothetical protein
MYSLITLYFGYFVYLIIFFRKKKLIQKTKEKSFLVYREITIILGIKLILLTVIYICFFSNKIPKKVIYENLNQQILQ